MTRRTLEFTVMPQRLELPAIRLRVPGQLPNSHRTPCLPDVIEAGNAPRERVVRDMKVWLSRRLPELDATIAGL